MLAWDAEALFPSMSAKKTGEIVRRRIQASPITPEGFDWKVGLVYIEMNRHLTGPLGTLKRILPHRRRTGGRAPGMTSKAMMTQDGDLEEQWTHKVKEVSRDKGHYQVNLTIS